ncbi:MAG: phospholipase D-like domain-containing protein [Pseudomonadota bacterium]
MEPEITAHFDDIHEVLLREIHSAETSIVSAVAWFTDREILNALLYRASHGVSVRVAITDDDINRPPKGPSFDSLIDLGGEIHRIRSGSRRESLMHHKFCVIDQSTVITGSYNWTRRARENAENITVVRNHPSFAARFVETFEQIVGQRAAGPDSIDTTQMCKRLELIRNLIQLGETSDLSPHVQRLRGVADEAGIGNALKAIDDGDYERALESIEQWLVRASALVTLEDAEVPHRRLELEALEWYRRAAEQGDAGGQFNLGVIYATGRGVPQDDREAVEWYRRAAEQGHADGQFNLGFMYQHGRGAPQDDREAVDWYRRAAEQGHAGGQVNLGSMYRDGTGVSQDDREAVEWYRRAAEQGHADGQFNLGFMYQDGSGLPQDDREAVEWYRRAAEQGHADGQFNLGLMCEDAGRYTEAAKWYRRAAEQGDAVGQSQLGFMYQHGRGVSQDDREAVEWFRRAAEQEYAVGQFNLGCVYLTGRGVPQDDREAVEWYRRAAKQGHLNAQRWLSKKH